VNINEALARKLAQPLQLAHLRLRCEREMFAVGNDAQRGALLRRVPCPPARGAAGSADAGGGADEGNEEVDGGGGTRGTLVASDVAALSLTTAVTAAAGIDIDVDLLVNGGGASSSGGGQRVLPQTLFAVSHVDLSVAGGDDEESAAGGGLDTAGCGTVGALVRRVGAALLLVGRVPEAAMLAAALLGRPDVAAACRDVLVTGRAAAIAAGAAQEAEARPTVAAQDAANALRVRVEGFDKAFAYFAS